jgi:hypothetical protein
MSAAVIASVYQDLNGGGTSLTYCAGAAGRYHRVPETELAGAGLDKQLSSARLLSAPDADTTLVLFGWPFFFSLGDYAGPFLQLSNTMSSADLDVNFTDHQFNDAASSLLLVATNRGSEYRLSFRDQFLDLWNTTIDAELGGDANRKGDPILTWEMFPASVSYLDPSSMYLKIVQELNINVPAWPDYDATITYHIFLYVDSGGHVRGYVARWAFWVEDGVKHDQIADRLRPKVISGMSDVDTKLGDQLNALSGFQVKDLYYLPGRQLTPTPTGAIAGSTWDDVTIVIVY